MTTTEFAMGRPGGSAGRAFRRERLRNLARQWRWWLALGTAGASSVFLATDGSTSSHVIGGWILGLVTAVALVGWLIGGDVHSLRWLRGAIGEEQTADELAKLPVGWDVVHDIACDYGNWDHVVVGPAGVFLVDSKNLGGRASVRSDGLSVGRVHYAGSGFRRAAVRLYEKLGGPWVQSVVAVWSDFPQEVCEERQVVYLSGTRLTDWLLAQPHRLDDKRRAELARLVCRLDGRDDSATRDTDAGSSMRRA